MRYLKFLLTFIRKYYLLIIVLSLAVNALRFIIASPPFTVFIPVLYLYLTTKILGYYRRSQGVALQSFNTVLASTNEKIRDTLLMATMYASALVPAGLTFLYLHTYGNPIQLYTYSAHQSQASLNLTILINNLMVSTIPFLIVISLFSFVPYVIFDSSEDARFSFILKKALKMVLRWYVLVLLIRVVASVRYLTVFVFLIFPFVVLVAAFDSEANGESGLFMLQSLFYFLLVIVLVVIPLYHTLMITLYEKARHKFIKPHTSSALSK